MKSYVDDMKVFWNSRFREERMIWGQSPSSTVSRAIDIFSGMRNIKKVLVPGSGYGRNSKAFCQAGFEVTGIEISEEALALAEAYNPEAKFYLGSFPDCFSEVEAYDAIYCYNLLHLFRQTDRKLFIDKCFKGLRKNGVAFFVVFSDGEASFGKGQQVEENTFESKPGRAVHYFSEEDLSTHFAAFNILETGLVEDEENHGAEGPHTHLLRYSVGIKP